jgi:probable F420-dependent oxidoreductase
MKIGISPDAVRSAAKLVELARTAEIAGFDSIWVPDHLAFFGSPVVDPFQALAALAAGSTKLLLGTAVYVLPLRAPAQVAKATASLDVLSGGRLILGVGVGGEFPGEYQASGVPVGERGKRMDESIAVIRHLWAGSGGAFAGRFSTIPEGLKLNPLPPREAGPPIWIGGRAEAAVRRAAVAGDGYLGFLFDAPGFAKRMRQVREIAAERGRDPQRIAAGLVTFGYVGDDGAAAIDAVAKRLESNYGVPMRAAVERYGIVGELAACADRVRALADAGVEHLVLASPFRGEEFHRQLPLLAKLVDQVRG